MSARRLELVGYAPPSLANITTLPSDSVRCDVKMVQLHYWSMTECQAARNRYYPTSTRHKRDANQKQLDGTKARKRHDGDGRAITGSSKDATAAASAEDTTSMSKRKKRGSDGTGHGGGVGKSRQGEVVAEFLIDVLMGGDNTAAASTGGAGAGDQNSPPPESSDGAGANTGAGRKRTRSEAVRFLASGSGVVDVAGGSGHVSLALGLRGIRSTVVDPRPNVGCLPGRDRKALRRALQKYGKKSEAEGGGKGGVDERRGGVSNTGSGEPERSAGTGGVEDALVAGSAAAAVPPVPFSSLRAWFVKKPDGVDVDFREGGTETPGLSSSGEGGAAANASDASSAPAPNGGVPVCGMCTPDGLLPSCSSIVALHPDEATGFVVDFAVEHRIPFLVVPCCVFSRLFPDRIKPGRTIEEEKGRGEVVSTYDDLIEWLRAKDPSIRVSELDFDGAHLAVWSTFERA